MEKHKSEDRPEDLPEDWSKNLPNDLPSDLPPELERYLALCWRTYERMHKEGTWPWTRIEPDSPNPDDMVESDDNQQNI